MTVELSSLDFSRDETRADEVTVSYGGAGLSAEAVSWLYTPAADEIGQASVEFVVPVGASGPTQFEVSVAPTGTTSSFILNVTAP